MLLSAALFFSFASIVFAHEAATFDPAEPNCMGKLTSFHAKDSKGIKNSAATWPHTGIGGPHDGTVKGHQKLSKAWCDSESDVPDGPS